MKSREPNPAGRPAAAPPKAPVLRGWQTSDEDEIRVRQWRAAAEPMEIRALDRSQPVFGEFAVRPKSTLHPYRVEIRALDRRENSCSCPDYRVNGLGTCKHIEAVLCRLRGPARRARTGAAAGPLRAEVFLSRDAAPGVRLCLPATAPAAVRRFLDPFFGADGRLLAEPSVAVPALLRAWAQAPAAVLKGARVSAEVADWSAELARRAARVRAREDFLRDVAAGKRTLDVVRHPLYPYQREGMLHLAFGERALLADEMGLGKTVQAVAACELLRQLRGIERVLVVAPASLKAEWEEQIAAFTGLPARIVWGGRAQRLKAYQAPAFFYLTNYEQARADVSELNRLVAPDVVILDEAQRIKNWQTKTAQTIKQLASPYAFVLTGTPLENRIDEVYSIAQFLDPAALGPLFRFNREFYELDERGRPVGLKNLAELHRRLRPLMLRRRKDEVEDQLPGRSVKTYFVAMADEQRARYADFEGRVAKLVAIAQRRQLLPAELEKLQRWLACMRMLCDTPYILDPECRICPKLEELRAVWEDALASGDSKIIVFSEWERMLHLARELAERMQLDYAWHTGSVPQQQRRADINRFKQDPACRLFLSTDSGATGLNLQAANIVINLDLPWNPARLEQRIARAWRKHQTRAVQVINLVCEDSLEHRMLATLAQKQQLADGVLDGRGDLTRMALPSGRAALMERLQSLMGAPVAPVPAAARPPAGALRVPPETAFGQDLAARLGSRLVALEWRERTGGAGAFLAVVDGDAAPLRPLAERLLREGYRGAAGVPALELVDRATYETIQRLVAQGVLQPAAPARQLHGATAAAESERGARERRLQAARAAMEQARRSCRMSQVLCDGGFPVEAVPAMRAAVELGMQAAAALTRDEPPAAGAGLDAAAVEALGQQAGLLPDGAAGIVLRLRSAAGDTAAVGAPVALELVKAGARLLEHVEGTMARAALA